MKKFYIILLIIFLIGTAGILKLRQFSNKNAAEVTQTKESSTSAKNTPIDYISDLLNQNKPLKCSFSYDLPGAEVKGDIYMHNDQVRADITSPDQKGKIKLSHTIFKDGTMYLWYDNEIMGLKLENSKLSSQSPENGPPDTEETNIQKKLDALNSISKLGVFSLPDMKCEPWEVDGFLLALPTKVSFIDGVDFYDELAKEVCAKCDLEETEASRLSCKKELACK